MKQSIDVISNRRNELRQKVGRCGIYGSRGELSSFSIPELSFTGTNDGEFGTLDRFDLTSLLERVYLKVYFVFTLDEVKRAVLLFRSLLSVCCILGHRLRGRTSQLLNNPLIRISLLSIRCLDSYEGFLLW